MVQTKKDLFVFTVRGTVYGEQLITDCKLSETLGNSVHADAV